MLGCLNPNVGKIWTNPNVGLKCNFNCIFNPIFGFVHILPKFGFKQPSLFLKCTHTVSFLHVVTVVVTINYAEIHPTNPKPNPHPNLIIKLHSKKMLGCFNPILGQIWTNPAIGLHF